MIKWTDEMDRMLMNTSNWGEKVSLSKKLGVSIAATKVRLRLLRGFNPPSRPSTGDCRPRIDWDSIDHRILVAHKAGATKAEISRQLGVSPASVRRRLIALDKLGVELDPEEEEVSMEADLVKKPPKHRPCLRCRNNFRSDDWDHRICPRCKRNEAKNESTGGIAEHRLAF